MQTAELVNLPLAERLQAMEALWESLCRDASVLDAVPEWHEEVLQKRNAAVVSGIDAVTPWEEAKTRISSAARQWASTRR
jgi:putative addiction module component (TIGR02574 family)